MTAKPTKGLNLQQHLRGAVPLPFLISYGMKRITIFCLILCLIGLICFPDATFAAATDAAMLWWSRVLPSLLPYLILTGMIVRLAPTGGGNVFGISRLAWSALLLGAVGGYPVGARVIGEARRQGTVEARTADRLLACCNLMNPGFVVSVTAVGIFHSAKAAIPMAISLYSVVLLSFFLLARSKTEPQRTNPNPFSAAVLTESIQSGIQAILGIGACILFCSVLLSLLNSLRLPYALAWLCSIPEATVSAVLSGLMEMTLGVQAVANLPLSVPLRLAVCCFFLQFGGASVFLQTLTVAKLQRPMRYLLRKGCMGILSAVLCFFLAKLLLKQTESVFFPIAKPYLPAVTTLSVAVSAGFGVLLLTLVATLHARPKKERKRRI